MEHYEIQSMFGQGTFGEKNTPDACMRLHKQWRAL
jgi:hypothetical protein